MPKAICEDCGSLVEAELTHNGICAVGHYVHCGWGHELSLDNLISDDVTKIIVELEKACAEWADVSQSNYQRAKTAEAERDALVRCLNGLENLTARDAAIVAATLAAIEEKTDD